MLGARVASRPLLAIAVVSLGLMPVRPRNVAQAWWVNLAVTGSLGREDILVTRRASVSGERQGERESPHAIVPTSFVTA